MAAATKPTAANAAKAAPSSTFEAFRQRFQQKLNPEGRKAIELLARWGLSEIQVVRLVSEHTTKRTATKRDHAQESDDELLENLSKLTPRLLRFHHSPAVRNLIEWMKTSPHPAHTGTDLVECAQIIDQIPRGLLMYTAMLGAAVSQPPTRAYPPKIFQSRMLYVLFLALKQADPSATPYRNYKRIEALMSAAGKSVESHKTFDNRIRRFLKKHSEEATNARAVVELYGAFGIQRLFAFSHKGLHVVSVH